MRSHIGRVSNNRLVWVKSRRDLFRQSSAVSGFDFDIRIFGNDVVLKPSDFNVYPFYYARVAGFDSRRQLANMTVG